MRNASRLGRILPITFWLQHYTWATLSRDLLGAAIVSFMFIPQSLAYAFLAGLPVSAGLYASILPLIGYAMLGTSRFLAVGPVAVISLLTASALAPLAAPGTAEYAGMALALALLSGLMLTAMGMFRMGFLSNFLSYPVVSGFVTASAILIAASQVKSVLGIETHGNTLLQLVPQLVANAPHFHAATAMVGALAIIFLILVRNGLAGLLRSFGMAPSTAALIARMGPLAAAAASTIAVATFGLEAAGVRTVGTLPGSLPPLTLPPFAPTLWSQLALSAFLISIIGFVESVSVAQTFAAKHRNLILPNNELLGLGAANIIASLCGAFPVSGGFSRSVVNYDAGVQTPVAAIFTGLGIALVVTFLAPFIAHVPQAVLAATIIVAVMSLADLKILAHTWSYSRADFAAAAVTILVTLLAGVEIGILCGVVLSVGLFLYRTSRPHMAVVGLVPNTEHFRNVLRHDVITSPHILSVRVDESLYFANARFLEERLTELLVEQPQVKHLVLICSAVNDIDASALESLEALNQRLKDMGVTFHLSEVKGPVMDRLRRSPFLGELSGKVFLSQFHAVVELDPGLLKRAWSRQHPGVHVG
jgi:sulfate permease, SulP family